MGTTHVFSILLMRAKTPIVSMIYGRSGYVMNANLTCPIRVPSNSRGLVSHCGVAEITYEGSEQAAVSVKVMME